MFRFFDTYIFLGFHLSRLESILIDSANLPKTTFVLTDSAHSFVSIDDRDELFQLLKTAFPKLEIRFLSNHSEPLNVVSNYFSDYVDKTTVTPSEENSNKQKILDSIFVIEKMEKRSCRYYLENEFCPLLQFCGKDHYTQDQLNSRIKAFQINLTENGK